MGFRIVFGGPLLVLRRWSMLCRPMTNYQLPVTSDKLVHQKSRRRTEKTQVTESAYRRYAVTPARRFALFPFFRGSPFVFDASLTSPMTIFWSTALHMS